MNYTICTYIHIFIYIYIYIFTPLLTPFTNTFSQTPLRTPYARRSSSAATRSSPTRSDTCRKGGGRAGARSRSCKVERTGVRKGGHKGLILPPRQRCR